MPIDTPATNGNAPPPHNPPPAHLRRPRFSFVWLVPILAAIIAAYLGYRTLASGRAAAHRSALPAAMASPPVRRR